MKKFLCMVLILAMVVSLLPAGLGGAVTVRASTVTVYTFAGLQEETEKVTGADIVRLGGNITDGAAQLTIARDLTIDLHGHNLTIDLVSSVGNGANGIKIMNGFTLTIQDDNQGADNRLNVRNRASNPTSGNGAAINTTEGTLIVVSGKITAQGGNASAGIGGGRASTGEVIGDGGNIIIYDGDISASGGDMGAGIGGGYYGNGGNIRIEGGEITATGRLGAGIGGGSGGSGGTIIITEGIINASDIGGGAGIGGGNGGSGGTIEIKGGTITAQGGGISSSGTGGGAGIGGGNGGNGGIIRIESGIIQTTGGRGSAGIGGGWNGNGGTIEITGGQITAQGGGIGLGGAGGGAGIGGGFNGNGGNITIDSDGSVEATGGQWGAGIGGGNNGNGGTIEITGGTVEAEGGINGAGIGGGNGGSGGTVTIREDTVNPTIVNSTGGNNSAGIGGGYEGDGGTIEITGGTVVARGGWNSAGIGGGYEGDGGTIKITGGTIEAEGGSGGGSGIGGGYDGDGGTITIENGKIEATSGNRGAGIGGGRNGSGGEITINGGEITATSIDSGAGIGGGINGSGGTIIINDGTIEAIGGWGGAGMGGGNNGNGGTIEINGGVITATGGEDGAGIGIGNNGTSGTTTITGGTVTASTSTAAVTNRAISNGSSGTVSVDGWFNYRVNTNNTDPVGDIPPNVGTLNFDNTTTMFNFGHDFRYIHLTPSQLFTVTLNSAGTGASGGGDYPAGVDVSIDAGTPPSGEYFVNWTAVLPSASPPPLSFVDENASVTSFAMPASDVTVTANFAEIATYSTTINIPQVSGSNPAPAVTPPLPAAQGATVNLPTVSANAGFVFQTWEVESGGVTSITNATQPSGASFVMGTENVVIKAVFIPATLTFNNQTLAAGTFNTPYTASVTAPTGGSGSYSYSAVLPAGLVMDSSGAISGTPNVVVTNATFTVTVVDTVSGATADAEYTLTVNPGVFTGTPNHNFNVQTGLAETYSVSLGGLAAGENFGTISGYTFGSVSDSLGIVSGTPSISGGTLSVAVNDMPQGTTGTATINITMHTQNYGNVSATVTLILTDKTQVTITANAEDTIYTGLPYAGLSGISASGGLDSALLEIMFAGRNTTAYSPSAAPPVDAGDYSVTISVPTDNPTYFGSEIFNFTVSPAALYISVNDITVQTGETPVFTYTVTGIVNNETAETALTSPPTVESPTADINTAGTYPIVITGGTASANYHIAERIDGTLTVVAPTDTPEITPPPTTYIPIEISGSVVLGDPARTPRETPATEPEEPEPIETEETEILNRARLQIGSNLIICLNQNTVLVEMDTVPVIQDGRTLIPLRFVANILGAHVSWNEAAREVTLTKGDRVLILPIGTITPELAALGMDVPPTITDGRTMVPLRFISEFFGATVLWDEAERSIEIIF